MRRRDFITGIAGIGGCVVARGARAQQPAMLGFIHNASQSYFAPFATPFRAGLKEAGYVEGRNLAIEYRWAEGHSDRLPTPVAFMDELRERPDNRDIPVVVITAKDLTDEDRDRLNGGVERIIQKSDRDEMLRQLSREVSRCVKRQAATVA